MSASPQALPLQAKTDTRGAAIEIGLNAAIVAVEDDTPKVLVVRNGSGISDRDGAATEGLPFGPFDPLRHRTIEIGLRAWVGQQTGLDLGYVEQLYTFGDRGRHADPGDEGPHVVSVGYLALSRPSEDWAPRSRLNATFQSWYDYFPWEDWRDGQPALVDDTILPLLNIWADRPEDRDVTRPLDRHQRLAIAFGHGSRRWDDERVLDRYELLYEAGLVHEALRDGRAAAMQRASIPDLGRPMRFDHRRVLATAMGRLRAKLKYRPVVFELMPQSFTLTELQHTVEAISGSHLHKQNFRRLVETTALVEPTGDMTAETGGRPAKLYRFRREILQERPASGVRVGTRG